MNKDIEEGNRIIGDFMGKNFKDPLNYMYDKSWDWLMPVVEKIEGLDLGVTVVIKENKCGIYRYKGSAYEYLLEKIETETKIAATYLAILKFIEWYKKNKEQ